MQLRGMSSGVLTVGSSTVRISDHQLISTSGATKNVLAKAVARILAAAITPLGTFVMYASLEDSEGSSDLYVVNIEGGQQRRLGAAAAEEFYVLGATYDGKDNWIITAAADLTTVLIVYPLDKIDTADSRVLQPYAYNYGPLVEGAVALPTGGFLLLQRYSEVSESPSSDDTLPVDDWELATLDSHGVLLETVKWPSFLSPPAIETSTSRGVLLDGIVNGNALIRTERSSVLISFDGENFTLSEVCGTAPDTWLARS